MSYLRLGEDEASVELISAEDRRRRAQEGQPSGSRPASNSMAAPTPAAVASAASASSSSRPASKSLASPAATVSGSPLPAYAGVPVPMQFAPPNLALNSSSSSAAPAATNGYAGNANPEGGQTQPGPPGFQVVMGVPAGSSPASSSALAASVSTPASMVPLYMQPRGAGMNDAYGPPPTYYFAIQPSFASSSSSSSSSSTVVFEGWLEKKSSGLISSWNRVFAVLTSSHFSYYTTEEDAHAKRNLKNSMPLTLFHSRVSPKDDGKKLCLTWKMKTDTRLWQFACGTPETRNQWIEKMNQYVT